jgi:hypothetical protein
MKTVKSLDEIFEYDPNIPSCLRRNNKIVKGCRVFVKRTNTPLQKEFFRTEEIIWSLFNGYIGETERVVKINKNNGNVIENLKVIELNNLVVGEISLNNFQISNKSPTGLIWNTYRISSMGNVSVYPGDIAGTADGRGYFSMNINNTSKKIHRIIWEIAFGEIPDGYIVDHIDGNKQNNILCNLRCIPHAQNARNASHPNKSESGVIGVHTYKRDGELFGYRVGWQDWSTGKPKGMLKYFYFKDYGDSAFDKACEFRQYKISELNSLGYGYTTRHGYKETNNECSY